MIREEERSFTDQTFKYDSSGDLLPGLSSI